jgi:hypothetical protein
LALKLLRTACGTRLTPPKSKLFSWKKKGSKFSKHGQTKKEKGKQRNWGSKLSQHGQTKEK